jgi:GTP-binding protein HflX
LKQGSSAIYTIQKEDRRERAIVVGLALPGTQKKQVEESLNELVLLADTAGAETIAVVAQDRRAADPATLIGSGKVKEIARLALDGRADLVIFDEDLTPVQVKNLEREIGKKVIDRSGLILDIFARHARSHESRIQVELAQLNYYYPRLTRQWSHLSRQEGGIGTRGPGETQLEVDRRLIRRRIDHLEESLKRIEVQRSIRRKKRQRMKKIAFVGYTNAGKSSLMNALANTQLLVEDRLFATLDAIIRTARISEDEEVLLIDTVGFIRKLPHHLVASFRSTLEESADADLLLHITDLSHSNYEEHIGTVQQVLCELGLDDKPSVYVFNKIDRLADRKIIADLKEKFPNAVFTSALKGIGLEQLRLSIQSEIRNSEIEKTFRVPVQNGRLIAMIYENVHVLNQRLEEDVTVIQVRGAPQDLFKIDRAIGRPE